MKLSQKQSQLLAAEVLSAIKKQGLCSVPEATIQKIRKWKETRDRLLKVEKEHEDARRKHDTTLAAITGRVSGVYPNNSIADIVDKIKEANVPSLSEIEDKIVLKAMFTTEEDLQAFVQSIVKEFSKKKATAVKAN